MKNNHISYNSKTNSVFAKSNNNSLHINGNSKNDINLTNNNGNNNGNSDKLNKSDSLAKYDDKLRTKPLKEANKFENSKSKNY